MYGPPRKPKETLCMQPHTSGSELFGDAVLWLTLTGLHLCCNPHLLDEDDLALNPKPKTLSPKPKTLSPIACELGPTRIPTPENPQIFLKVALLTMLARPARAVGFKKKGIRASCGSPQLQTKQVSETEGPLVPNPFRTLPLPTPEPETLTVFHFHVADVSGYGRKQGLAFDASPSLPTKPRRLCWQRPRGWGSRKTSQKDK